MKKTSETLDIRKLGPCIKKVKKNKGFRVKNYLGHIIVVPPYTQVTYIPKNKKS